MGWSALQPKSNPATLGPARVRAMAVKSCSSCGCETLEPGFLLDYGGRGYTRWIRGALERGVFGGAKLMGKERWDVEAYRCTACSKLELYVTEPTPQPNW
jgi:hypothetical protein